MTGRPARPRVLVAGDANLDLVLTGDVVPAFGQHEQLLAEARLTLGSSAGITAAGLARLDVTAGLVAAVGDDAFGALVADELTGHEVDATALLVRDGASTGLSVVLADGDDRAILTLTGAMATLTAEDVWRAADTWRPDHVHVASYFLLPELAAGLPELLGHLRATGITTSLDTNADPSRRWAGLDLVLPRLDVFLPNARELEGLARALDLPDDLEGAARAIASRGPMVAVKDGAEGAVLVTADGSVTTRPAYPAAVVDTTGAGDSFDAAFLAAWLGGLPPAQALDWGCAAGALAVRGVGGTAGQGDRRAIAALISG